MEPEDDPEEQAAILRAATETFEYAQALTADMAVPTAAQSFVLVVAAAAASMQFTNKEGFLTLAAQIWEQIESGDPTPTTPPSMLN